MLKVRGGIDDVDEEMNVSESDFLVSKASKLSAREGYPLNMKM